MEIHAQNDKTERNDGIFIIYILAPVTIILAIGVITYIIVKQRQLTRRMIESGQLVPVMPAVVTYQQFSAQHLQQQQQELRSPTTGLPPPPPYSK